MRWSVAAALLALVCAGCGGARHAAVTTRAAPNPSPNRKGDRLHVGVVGRLAFSAPGVTIHRGTLAGVAGDPLVLVDARDTDLPTVAAAARAHPSSHYALVGASAATERAPNLVGLVLDDGAAAELAGEVAGTVAAAQAGGAARIAWVGPEERRLAARFGRGVRRAQPRAQVLHQWSRSVPARCKQAALTGIERGAVVVMASGGICAQAAVAAAHERNQPALTLDEFELPGRAAAAVVRDALAGAYHGGEDIVFGRATGAIGVRALDALVPPDVAAQARAATQDLPSAG